MISRLGAGTAIWKRECRRGPMWRQGKAAPPPARSWGLPLGASRSNIPRSSQQTPPPPPEEDEAFERVGRTAGATQRSAEARPSAGRQTFPFTLRSEGARESPSELLCKESILKLKDLEPPTGICALLSVFTTLRGAPLTPADTNITPSTVPASNRSFGSVHATSH